MTISKPNDIVFFIIYAFGIGWVITFPLRDLDTMIYLLYIQVLYTNYVHFLLVLCNEFSA